MANPRLTRVIEHRREYERLKARVEELRSIAEKVTPTLSLTPKGTGGHKDDSWVNLLEYESQCANALARYERDRIELDLEIESIEIPNVRTALKYYYLDGLTIDDIAINMQFSSRSIDRLLKKGREEYDRIYDTENKKDI